VNEDSGTAQLLQTSDPSRSPPVPQPSDHPVPEPTGTQIARLKRLRPQTRDPILNRLRELQEKIPPTKLTNHQLWLLYLEAAEQIIDEIPGQFNPFLPPEKMLLFLVDLHSQSQD
jgi:hypothetical protein